MAKHRKVQPKSATKKKKRSKKYRPPSEELGPRASATGPGPASADAEYSGGAMQSMVGGFRRAVGVKTGKAKGAGDYIWTILLVLAIAVVVYWKFGPN